MPLLMISAGVWLVAGVLSIAYAVAGLLYSLPGVVELRDWLSGATGWYIPLAAFAAILLEGTYIIGIFFPGATVVLLLGIFSAIYGASLLVVTCIAIFLGWSLTGVINAKFGSLLHRRFRGEDISDVQEAVVGSSLVYSWFPNFRANLEVAQVAQGLSVRDVVFKSTIIKFFVSFVMLLLIFVVTAVFDVEMIENDEGFLALAFVGIVCLVVGGLNVVRARR
ncbi:hypothetical protein HUK65_17030 [Rhodobacteraceae bacterium 2376]|uniref:TVP38/TMEM64 family membrane protein n=1 Tax=Rhabdonatronobacter sediminivivens TaxID=2743469 RepID=A0A7Z0I347_9RHOB|nr:hypothetical protein [Rhabdonatronobacter sediminivivens]NYS26687.1 hypothetical protein [Rhabdonatronobacter sediminivivens]